MPRLSNRSNPRHEVRHMPGLITSQSRPGPNQRRHLPEMVHEDSGRNRLPGKSPQFSSSNACVPGSILRPISVRHSSSAGSPGDQRQLVLPVGDDYFCRSQWVIIRYRRCRIGYGSASRKTEAKTNGRKDATDGGGDGRDERALCPQVTARPAAVGDQDRAPVADPP